MAQARKATPGYRARLSAPELGRLAHGPGGLTVGALLAEPLLRDTLVAGAAGVDRPVRWCLPLSELPANEQDPTGIVVYAHAEQLVGDLGADTVRRAHDAGAVALLVALDTAATDPFIEAKALAEACGLPLALLTPAADYRAVSQLVATKVLAQTTHVLQYSEWVHRSLGEILARGAGISPLAYGMARMGEVPVLAVDLDGTLLAYESARRERKPEAESVVEALARRLRELDDRPLPMGPFVMDPIDCAGETVLPIVAAMSFGGEPNGLVALLEPPDSNPHDNTQRRIIAQEGAVLIGSEMLRVRSMIEAEERTRGDFVVELVHGRFADGQQLQVRARHHGFATDGGYVVHVAEIDPPLAEDIRSIRRFNAAARAVERLDAPGTTRTLATQIGGKLVVVSPIDATDDLEPVRETAAAIRRVLRERLETPSRVAFGRPGTGASGVATSYRQARTALALGRRVDAPPVSGYDDLRIFVAIGDLADSENGRRFAGELLAPLRRPDGNGRTLESVALAYITESGNLNAAARRLGLHRNTTLYKLERVSRVLNMDIRSADAQFMVWLAHHIDALCQVGHSLDAELAPPP
jgi:sugar diacid utilization regulator